MHMMVGAECQTDPMEPEDILKLLEQKSSELRRTTAEQNEIHEVIVDTGKSSPNPKNESEYEKSCGNSIRVKSSGLPTTFSSEPVSLTPPSSRRRETEKLHDFPTTSTTTNRFSNADRNSWKLSRRLLLGRSHSLKGSSFLSCSTSRLNLDSYCRRASGGASLIRPVPCSTDKRKLFQSGSCYGYPPTARSSDRCRSGSRAEPHIRPDISTTLSIPSRQASVRSCSSARSYGSEKGKINTAVPSKSFSHQNSQKNTNSSSMRSLPMTGPGRSSRSFSILSITTGGIPLKDLPPKERRHKKVAFAVYVVFSFLLLIAVLCIIVSLHFSLRKENERIVSHLHPTTSTMNASSTAPTSIISSKENFGGGGSSRTTPTSSASPLSDSQLSDNNNNLNTHKESPPLSQSLIGKLLWQKQRISISTFPSPMHNTFDLDIGAADLEVESGIGAGNNDQPPL